MSDPKIEEIRTAHAMLLAVGFPDENTGYLLTKLDEAEQERDAAYLLGMASVSRKLEAAGERERALIAGVKEAIARARSMQRTEGETFGEWLGRCSIETMHSQIASEDAARRWLAAHDAEVARKALKDAADFISTPGVLWHGDDGVTVYADGAYGGNRMRLTDWLRTRAEQIGEK